MTEALRTGKDKIERMCRAAGMAPADRRKVGDYDLLIADGFSLPPHRVFRRFGVEPNEFPNGCYVVIAWLMKGEERMFLGTPIVFDAFHDPAYDKASKRRMRLNRAESDVKAMLKRMRKLH